MPESFRLFFALWPDVKTRKALSVWQSALSGRKVPAENLHITLALLGEQPAAIVPELARILESVSAGAIRLSLDKRGYFSHSRICWAGMDKIPDKLIQLHQKLITALSEQSISHDRRTRFKPHVTLARHCRPIEGANLQPVVWHADHLVLMKSRLGPGQKGNHPEYIPIAERRLGS